MTGIEVRRPRSYAWALRRFAIFVDDAPVGHVRNNRSLPIRLAAGRHQVQARVGHRSSEYLTVELINGEERGLRIVVNLALEEVRSGAPRCF